MRPEHGAEQRWRVETLDGVDMPVVEEFVCHGEVVLESLDWLLVC